MTGPATGKLALTLLVGALGGWIMWHLHMPLAWLLGAMIACGLAALLGLPLALPPFVRPPMTATIGVMLGASFSPSVFDHVGLWIVSLLGLSVFIAAAGAIAYIYFRKIGGFDHPTAFFSAMPGTLGGVDSYLSHRIVAARAIIAR